MSMSLREQLLQAGLGTKKQAKQAERHQHQQIKSQVAKEEQQKRAAEAQAAKAARDQELNRKRQENLARKERWAQIKQLIEQNRVPKPESDEYFNFIDREKVRRMPVDAPLRERIIRGELVIVRCEGRYDVVPAETGERIREREPRALVVLAAPEERASVSDANDNDPYKDYVVPDDLVW